MNTFILASASPRRTALLNQAGIEHLVMPSKCAEQSDEVLPPKVVEDLSCQKANDVYLRYLSEHPEESFIVLGSDTIVAYNDTILGKPADHDDAVRMISLLQNNTHQVYTGVTLLTHTQGTTQTITFHECSEVMVYPMSTEEITQYVNTNEPFDKAGGYGIQGRFAVHIKGIRGDYNNIVGLPIAGIYQRIKNLFLL